MTRTTVSIEAAARELGIGRALAYRAARCGELPTIKIGRRLLVPRPALDRLLAEGRMPATVKGPAETGVRGDV